MQLASLSNQLALEGKAVKRVQVLGGKEVALGPNCAAYDGYNVHANVHFEAMDRAGLERLCRYVLRPPLALPRIERLTGVDGQTRVRIGMKRTYSDGTHAIELSALGLAEKLACTRILRGLERGTGPPGAAGADALQGAQQRVHAGERR